MNEMYLGSIFLWPLNWVPEDLMFCNGQLLSVSQNQALFSLLSNLYGGDGRTTFALPDLRSRVPIGTNMNAGASPNLTPVNLAQKGGNENTSLIAHTHQAALANTNVSIQGSLLVNNAPATLETPTPGASLASIMTTDGSFPNPNTSPALGYNNEQPNTPLLGLNISPGQVTGNVTVGQSGNSNGQYANMQPFLGMNYVMVVNGIYPVRQ